MYPTNQTAAELLTVPVLPAAGRPSVMAAPVRPWSGPSMTWLRIAVTESATLRGMICLHLACGTGRSLPSRSVICAMATGLQRTPWLARTA